MQKHNRTSSLFYCLLFITIESISVQQKEEQPAREQKLCLNEIQTLKRKLRTLESDPEFEKTKLKEELNTTINEILNQGKLQKLDPKILSFLGCTFDFKKLLDKPFNELFPQDFLEHNGQQFFATLSKYYYPHIRDIIVNNMDVTEDSLNSMPLDTNSDRKLEIKPLLDSCWMLRYKRELILERSLNTDIKKCGVAQNNSLIYFQLADGSVITYKVPLQTLDNKFSPEQLTFLIELCHLTYNKVHHQEKMDDLRHFDSYADQLLPTFDNSEEIIIKSILEQIKR